MSTSSENIPEQASEKYEAADAPNLSGPNFIEQIVTNDLNAGTVASVVTRFPPEPNGYLHIGHATAVCLQFGIARDFKGRCHLRFDDTNPETERMEYVEAAKEDIRWLGFDWGEHLYFASDYFEQLYAFAQQLVRGGKAYVDSLNEAEIREYRGTVTEAGRPSPHRDRSVDENLELLAKMRDGSFPDGSHVLRAKIDMASPNMLMRDPVLYRIKHAEHYRRGNEWPIYPLYDFAHPLSDAIEGITHSLCTLEFDVHRPLYDWLVDAVTVPPRPYQYEYARRNLEYTVVSKRKLLQLVNEGHVDGWDDPRMPTIAGVRRRGVTAGALRRFSDLVGIAKSATRIDIALLEYAIRDDLNHQAPRVMAVLDPLKVTITNWPDESVEWLEASYWPHDVPKTGFRKLPFGRSLVIDRADFRENPPKHFHRLSQGVEVRLRHGYVIRCNKVVRDDDGNVVELLCTYDPETKSGGSDQRRVKGTLHWVEATNAVSATARLYDRLFRVPNPDDVPEGGSFLDELNPNSKKETTVLVEHSVAGSKPGDRFQFEREGYFIVDQDSADDALVFDRTITLRDTWAKLSGGDRKPGPRKGSSKRASRQKAGSVHDGPPIPSLSEEQEADARHMERSFGLTYPNAAVLASDVELRAFFLEAASKADPRLVGNWVLHELQRERKGRSLEDLRITPAHLVELLGLIRVGTISSRTAKDVFSETVSSGDAPAVVVERRGLTQIDDEGALREAASAVVSANAAKVNAYRAGKHGLIGFFIGQVMAQTGGKANPGRTREILQELLGS